MEMDLLAFVSSDLSLSLRRFFFNECLVDGTYVDLMAQLCKPLVNQFTNTNLPTCSPS